MKWIKWIGFLFLIILLGIVGLNYKTEFSDLPYPAKVKEVKYTPCIFTISYSSNNPKSKDYGIYKTDSFPLKGLESLSKDSCKCVEDALKIQPKGIQQFEYVDNPFFVVDVEENSFNIMIEMKDIIGTKILNFNEIIKYNKNNLCKKWRY